MPHTIPDHKLLTDAGLGEMLRVSGRTIQRMAHRPGFPRPMYVGRCRRWNTSEILDYLRQQSAVQSQHDTEDSESN
jgi:predicted DNA-binding transcriptional regulator AlpA